MINQSISITRCQIFQLECKNSVLVGRAYSAPPDPLTSMEGLAAPCPRTSPYRSWPFELRSWLCSSENFFRKPCLSAICFCNRQASAKATGFQNCGKHFRSTKSADAGGSASRMSAFLFTLVVYALCATRSTRRAQSSAQERHLVYIQLQVQ